MLIDRTHRPWFLFSVILLALAAASYVFYSSVAVGGPRGGSVPGLIYGSIGSALMLYAGLLGLRKKFAIVRVGRATSWMRGHLWLGALSFPLILFHAAFRLGSGPLTRLLMILFVFVFVSGLVGVVLQHYLPRVITERVPMETIYDQIQRVRCQLADEASILVNEIVATLEGDLAKAGSKQRTAAASAGTRGNMTFAAALGVDEHLAVTVNRFYASEMRPYLLQSGGRKWSLAQPEQVAGTIRQLRVLLPKDLWSKLEDLENICEEKRQLDRQSRLHKMLHGWLLIHVPASYALLLLGAVHAVVALRY